VLHSHLAPDHLAAALPTTLWIELTSRCPFDCVFCSRKLRRGAGEHMDFSIFRSLIGQLRNPETLRLNYSGESIHYPHLIEAIRLAKSTGAMTELVTALASAPPGLVEELVDSGLDLLRVSVHAADATAYNSVYRFSSIDSLRVRLREFLERRESAGTGVPKLEFAYVAMSDNLDQLAGVVALARECAVTEIQVLPVVRRDPILFDLAAELDSANRIRPAFAERLRETLREVQRSAPDVRLTLTNPEAEYGHVLGPAPTCFPDTLPRNARISTCEQNPWDTVHILANGDVVVCEVRDKVVMGNLAHDTLGDIWLGENYRAFRREYVEGAASECRTCPWKVAYLPAMLSTRITASREFQPQLLTGWFDPEEKIVWSRRESHLTLANPAGSAGVRIRGALPPGLKAESNQLTIECGGRTLAIIENSGQTMLHFDRFLPLPLDGPYELHVKFTTRFDFTPARHMLSADARPLGFSLSIVEVVDAETPSIISAEVVAPCVGQNRLDSLRNFRRASKLVDLAGSATHRLRIHRRVPRPAHLSPGVTVIIPERGNPELLRECLDALALAVQHVEEPVETIVVASDATPDDYLSLAQDGVRWIYSAAPLHFSAAVRTGLRAASHPWVYLLNNDMTVDAGAIAALLPHRAPNVFALGSQIFFQDSTRRREETNLSKFRFADGLIELYEIEPSSIERPEPSFYAGGGSSLFQTRLLMKFMGRDDPYAPLYWEDVEWSTLARKHGFDVLLCPRSKVFHVQRATALKYYSSAEVERIFKRNRIAYQLRNLTQFDAFEDALRHLTLLDESSFAELTTFQSLAGVLKARLESWLCPRDSEALSDFLPTHLPPRKASTHSAGK